MNLTTNQARRLKGRSMRTLEEIAATLEPWTAELRAAAAQEGWELTTWTTEPQMQIQCIDDPEELPEGATQLPSDIAAWVVVRTGTGEHHAAARKIIHDHYPDEWALMEEVVSQLEAEALFGRACE